MKQNALTYNYTNTQNLIFWCHDNGLCAVYGPKSESLIFSLLNYLQIYEE